MYNMILMNEGGYLMNMIKPITDQEKQEMLNLAELQHKLYRDIYEVKVQIEEGGQLPSKVRVSDAGFDLYATEDITLVPGQSGKTPLNIRLELPANTYAEITTKSGLGSKGHSVRSGIVDSEYRGIVHVIHSNVSIISHIDVEGYPIMRTEPLVIKKGDKIAQLIIHPFNSLYYITRVDQVDMNTDRGDGGFGSTGR